MICIMYIKLDGIYRYNGLHSYCLHTFIFLQKFFFPIKQNFVSLLDSCFVRSLSKSYYPFSLHSL